MNTFGKLMYWVMTIAPVLLVSACATGGGGAVCGDGICSEGEIRDCPGDCQWTCPNTICDPIENATSCPQDCYCGNGSCEESESETTCPEDCGGGTGCGDGYCDPGAGETETTCPEDCGGETGCGDGYCDPDAGETETTCAEDCGGGTGCDDPTCDLFPQCGCDPGDKCTVVGTSRTCVAAGSTQHGDICTAETDCVAATACLGGGAESRCLQFCGDDTDCPGGEGSLCVLGIDDGSGNSVPGASLCTVDCSPVTPSMDCPSGWGCDIFFLDENGDDIPDRFLTDCISEVGSAPVGGYCDDTTLCAPGAWCYINVEDPTYTNTCIQHCRVGASDCTGGTTCYAYDEPTWIGSTQYGFCI